VRDQWAQDKHNHKEEQELSRKKAHAMPEREAYDERDCPHDVDLRGDEQSREKLFESEYANDTKQHKHHACPDEYISNKHHFGVPPKPYYL